MPGYELIGREERANISKLFKDKSNFFCGKTVKEFEQRFKVRFGSKYSQACTSCTAALKIAIEALELPKGSEIITSAFTFVATAEAILEAGHKPVFADIDMTYNLDPESVLEKIGSKTKAIIPVSMYGSPADMISIMEIAKEHNLFVIEDVAQGLGAEILGKSVGTFGDIGCFSFDAGKTLGTGDGGMILTDNEVFWRRAYEYFDHGHQNNPLFPRGRDTRRRPGFNYRMTELQAAIGLAQLGKISKVFSAQEKNYNKIFYGVFNTLFDYRTFIKGSRHTYEALIFTLPDKELCQELYSILKKEGIITKNLPDAYDWHFAGTWAHMGVKHGSFPATRNILERSIAIMIFVKMNKEQIKKIIRVLNDFHKNDKPSFKESSLAEASA
jgi:8-amino-3,8-dideoxy-alpha-D-manno-octulosonate transaminase